jgi:hypothetical protein
MYEPKTCRTGKTWLKQACFVGDGTKLVMVRTCRVCYGILWGIRRSRNRNGYGNSHAINTPAPTLPCNMYAVVTNGYR